MPTLFGGVPLLNPLCWNTAAKKVEENPSLVFLTIDLGVASPFPKPFSLSRSNVRLPKRRRYKMDVRIWPDLYGSRHAPTRIQINGLPIYGICRKKGDGREGMLLESLNTRIARFSQDKLFLLSPPHLQNQPLNKSPAALERFVRSFDRASQWVSAAHPKCVSANCFHSLFLAGRARVMTNWGIKCKCSLFWWCPKRFVWTIRSFESSSSS